MLVLHIWINLYAKISFFHCIFQWRVQSWAWNELFLVCKTSINLHPSCLQMCFFFCFCYGCFKRCRKKTKSRELWRRSPGRARKKKIITESSPHVCLHNNNRNILAQVCKISREELIYTKLFQDADGGINHSLAAVGGARQAAGTYLQHRHADRLWEERQITGSVNDEQLTGRVRAVLLSQVKLSSILCFLSH